MPGPKHELASKAQEKWAFAAENRGELKAGTAERWASAAKGRKLPETAVISHVDSDQEALKQKTAFHKKVKK